MVYKISVSPADPPCLSIYQYRRLNCREGVTEIGNARNDALSIVQFMDAILIAVVGNIICLPSVQVSCSNEG
jgi:hypothetical protein